MKEQRVNFYAKSKKNIIVIEIKSDLGALECMRKVLLAIIRSNFFPNCKVHQMKTVAYFRLFGYVYGACLMDVFIDRQVYLYQRLQYKNNIAMTKTVVLVKLKLFCLETEEAVFLDKYLHKGYFFFYLLRLIMCERVEKIIALTLFVMHLSSFRLKHNFKYNG